MTSAPQKAFSLSEAEKRDGMSRPNKHFRTNLRQRIALLGIVFEMNYINGPGQIRTADLVLIRDAL